MVLSRTHTKGFTLLRKRAKKIIYLLRASIYFYFYNYLTCFFIVLITALTLPDVSDNVSRRPPHRILSSKIALLTLVVYTHHVRAISSYHRWTNKKPCWRKLLSFMLWYVPVHRSFWVLFALNALGDRDSSATPIVGVLWLKSYSYCGKARLFRKCCMRPHAFVYHTLMCLCAWSPWPGYFT